MTFRKFISIFVRPSPRTEVQIRGEAWFLFEAMVIKRIKENYPKEAEEMMYNLLA